MSKQQTGLRIDRVLFKQFQQLCAVEKLRPGEAVESLVRLAVDSGSIAALSASTARQGKRGNALAEVLFSSRLSRLKASLESERKYWMETGEEIEDPNSEELVRELTEIGRRSVNEELVKEFQTSLTESDKLYEDMGKSTIERWIKETRDRSR